MKNIFEKNFQNFQQLPLPFNAIFPTLSKINEIYEDYKISASSKYRRMAFESLNDSKSRGGRFISKLRWIDPHVPHRGDTRKRWIVVHVQKKHACIIAKRFWHVESNRFLHVPTFPNQTEPERARELSFLLRSEEGRNFFLSFLFVDPLERTTDAIKTLHLDGR